MSVLDTLLEKDKVETGATGEDNTNTPPTPPSTETNTEKNDPDPPKVEGSEQVNSDPPQVDPWFKKHGFESEEKAEEFINNSKTKVAEPVKPKFSSSKVEEYNNFVANGGPDDFQIFQTVKNFSASENPTEDEMIKAIVTKRIIDDPDFKGKEAYLEKKIKTEFGLIIEEEFASEEEKEEREIGLIGLKKEFKKTAEAFTDMKSKTTPVVDEKLATHLKEAPEKLKAYLDKKLESVPELKLPKLGENGEPTKDTLISTIFDENQTKRFREYYESISQGQGYPDLGDGSQQEQIEKVAMGLVFAENYISIGNKIWQDAVAWADSKNIEKEIKDTNPSAKSTHEKKVVGDQTDRSGEIFDKK